MSEQIYSVISTKGGQRRVVMETNNVIQAFHLIARLSATAWQGDPDPIAFHVQDADGNVISEAPAPPATE